MRAGRNGEADPLHDQGQDRVRGRTSSAMCSRRRGRIPPRSPQLASGRRHDHRDRRGRRGIGLPSGEVGPRGARQARKPAPPAAARPLQAAARTGIASGRARQRPGGPSATTSSGVNAASARTVTSGVAAGELASEGCRGSIHGRSMVTSSTRPRWSPFIDSMWSARCAGRAAPDGPARSARPPASLSTTRPDPVATYAELTLQPQWPATTTA